MENTTPIAELHNIYGNTEFIFCITHITHSEDEYKNTLLTIDVTSAATPVATYVINLPGGKSWKAVDPQQGTAYTGKIVYYDKHDRYSLTPLAEADASAYPQAPTHTTTITYYHDLPQTPGTPFNAVCVVLDTTVDNPSMLLKTTEGVFRVRVPKVTVTAGVASIHNKLISVILKRGLKKTSLRILEVLGDASVSALSQLQMHSIAASTHTTNVSSSTKGTTIQISDIYLDDDTEEWTVTRVEQLSDDVLVWLKNTSECEVYHTGVDVELLYTQKVVDYWPWGAPSIPVLAMNLLTSDIVILKETDIYSQFRPLLPAEIDKYSYSPIVEDELPF